MAPISNPAIHVTCSTVHNNTMTIYSMYIHTIVPFDRFGFTSKYTDIHAIANSIAMEVSSVNIYIHI